MSEGRSEMAVNKKCRIKRHFLYFFEDYLALAVSALTESGAATGVVSAGAVTLAVSTLAESTGLSEAPPPQEANATVAIEATTNNFKVFMINCLKGFDIKFPLIQILVQGNPMFLKIFEKKSEMGIII